MFVFYDCRFAVILDVPSLLLWSCFAANCQMKNFKPFSTVSLSHFLIPCKCIEAGVLDLCHAVSDYDLFMLEILKSRNSELNTFFSCLQGMQLPAVLTTDSLEVLKVHARLQGIWQLSALDSDALHLFSFDLIRCNSIYLLSPLVLLLSLLLLPRNQQKPTKNNNNDEWKIDACTIWQKLTNEKRKTTNNKMSKNENKNKKLFVPISFPK